MPSLIVDGTTLTPQYSDVNGYMYWGRSGTSLHYTHTWGWVYARGYYPGYEPYEEYDYDQSKYVGDWFYIVRGFPYREGSTGSLAGRGEAREEAPLEMELKWERWTNNQEFGEYEAQGGASGTKILGLPRWRGSDGQTYTRSLKKTNGYYTYGAIHNQWGRWLIGTNGSESGWHEGSEPQRNGSTTFRFTRNEGSEATGNDISVSFDRFVAGDETDAAYLGEAAIWR